MVASLSLNISEVSYSSQIHLNPFIALDNVIFAKTQLITIARCQSLEQNNHVEFYGTLSVLLTHNGHFFVFVHCDGISLKSENNMKKKCEDDRITFQIVEKLKAQREICSNLEVKKIIIVNTNITTKLIINFYSTK